MPLDGHRRLHSKDDLAREIDRVVRPLDHRLEHDELAAADVRDRVASA